MKIREQVKEFHEAFCAPVLKTPQIPDSARIRLRLKLISEEFFEFLESVIDSKKELRYIRENVFNTILYKNINVNMPDLADALADLDYVVEGTRLEFGINGESIANEVHRSNMEKIGGEKRYDGKVLKPKNWKPPNIENELILQGWKK